MADKVPVEVVEVSFIRQLVRKEWAVQRTGYIDEVSLNPHGLVRYRIQVQDGERRPFVTKFFNDVGAAYDLLDRIIRENESG